MYFNIRSGYHLFSIHSVWLIQLQYSISSILYLVKKIKIDGSFEAFMAVMLQDEVFWVVTSWCVVVAYQHFRGPCCLSLQD